MSDQERLIERRYAAEREYSTQVQHLLQITPVSGDDIAIARRMNHER